MRPSTPGSAASASTAVRSCATARCRELRRADRRQRLAEARLRGGATRLVGIGHERVQLRAELRRDADAAQQVGREHDVALGGEPVGDVGDVRDEAPDLVDEDDPARGRPLGVGAVGATAPSRSIVVMRSLLPRQPRVARPEQDDLRGPAELDPPLAGDAPRRLSNTSASTSGPKSTPASAPMSAIGTWNVRNAPSGGDGEHALARASSSSDWSSTKPGGRERARSPSTQAATFQKRRGTRMPRYGGSSAREHRRGEHRHAVVVRVGVRAARGPRARATAPSTG